MKKNNIRNIAIIAHVDHGKTTIVDSLLKFSGQFDVKSNEDQDMVLDSSPLEREKGITIFAKCISINYKETIINIVDTPGHTDFSSEVERVIKMVDGVILMVDAVEGPMPQTRFVLKKALALGLKTVVTVSKMDRIKVISNTIIDDIFDLFIKLGATDEQLNFPILYTSGRECWASTVMKRRGCDMEPFFTTIMSHIPPPATDAKKPLQVQIAMIHHNNFLGDVGIGRISSGTIKKGQQVAIVNDRSSTISTKISKIVRIDKFYGLGKQEVEEAEAGNIILISGLENVKIGDTICSIDNIMPLPQLEINEPTVSMNFLVNDSPFSGRDGKFLTSKHIKTRLEKEIQTNIGLKFETIDEKGIFKVSGRGELHLIILIETMRREGFELAVSSPETIYKEKDGKISEPMELLVLSIENQYQGAVFELVGKRSAKLENMVFESEKNMLRLDYIIPTRALIGFKTDFLTSTHGHGTMNHSFYDYMPKINITNLRRNGVFIAKEYGRTTAYALENLQSGGQLFIKPGVEVYAGMIVGQNSREKDLVVNPCKSKKLSNMRSKGSDSTPMLKPSKTITLELAVEYIAPDELVEITPKSIRLRKKNLDHLTRKEHNHVAKNN